MNTKYCIEDCDVLRYTNSYFRAMKMAKKLSCTKGTVCVWSLKKKCVIRTYSWGRRQ